jgi:hypothetical protein
MLTFNADNAVPESILARFPDLIHVDPSDLAPLRFQPNFWARLIEDWKRYAHSGGFSADGVYRPVKFDGNHF